MQTLPHDVHHSYMLKLMHTTAAPQDVDDVPERVLIDADKRLGVGRVDTSAAAAEHESAAAAGRRCVGKQLWLLLL